MTYRALGSLLRPEERTAWRACLLSNIVPVAKAREILCSGEYAEALIIVLSGWVQRYKQLRGRRQIVSLYLPGEICDQSALVGQRATTSLAAVRNAEVALVAPSEAQAVSARFPGVARLLRASLAAQIRIEREWMANIGLRNAEERIAHLCCELLVRQGHKLRGAVEAPLPLNQAQLGEAVGLTPVHVNRTLSALRGRYGLSARDQRLDVTDAAALAALAQFDAQYLNLDAKGLLEGQGNSVPMPAREGASARTGTPAYRDLRDARRGDARSAA